jgi:hypothetical protein
LILPQKGRERERKRQSLQHKQHYQQQWQRQTQGHQEEGIKQLKDYEQQPNHEIQHG